MKVEVDIVNIPKVKNGVSVQADFAKQPDVFINDGTGGHLFAILSNITV